MLPIQQLEQYTLQYPEEVLMLTVQLATAPDEDEIIIFKGFSSFLTRSTEVDPDVPLLGEADQILTVCRLQSPYIPGQSQVIEADIRWKAWQTRQNGDSGT